MKVSIKRIFSTSFVILAIFNIVAYAAATDLEHTTTTSINASDVFYLSRESLWEAESAMTQYAKTLLAQQMN